MRLLSFTTTVSFYLLFSTFGFSQTGTSGDPFTALDQAWMVTTDGYYEFAIGTDKFTTYVESGSGWILIASGNAATTESSYAVTQELFLQSDNILSSTVYSSTLITGVRLNATSGPDIPFDVVSTSSAVLANLNANTTLSVNTNSSDWTGTGTAEMLRLCASNSGTLNTRIYHACGYTQRLHWQVGQNSNHEKLGPANTTKNNLNLWVRANQPIVPIELIDFGAKVEQNKVRLAWSTAAEINNSFFTIERSKDTYEWENVAELEGAGNSNTTLNYYSYDNAPLAGNSFYRLKQTDYDGSFSYSDVVRISLEREGNLKLYPNPTAQMITITGGSDELQSLEIYSLLGKSLGKINQGSDHARSIELDLSDLRPGVYIIKSKYASYKVHKL